jgi:hypothetical protein
VATSRGNAVDAHVALHVHKAVLQLVHLGDEDGQWSQAGPLHREKLAPAPVQLAAVGGVDLVAPGGGFPVQVLPVVEVAVVEKVVFDPVKRPLDTGRAIGIAHLMGREDKAKALAKGRHLRPRHRDSDLPEQARLTPPG